MKTHIILDLDKFGIWNDDYDQFFEERAVAINSELETRIITQTIDTHTLHTLPEEETETMMNTPVLEIKISRIVRLG